MCGIAGIVCFTAEAPDHREALGRMLDAQRHRGPDAEGRVVESGLYLGHRRLTVIDLSEGANQPMTDPSGRYVITFNGEIYNYLDLRAQLRDYAFRTRSDTEVILAAFVRWGDACVEHLKGQFAFALWDRQAKRLFMARDRLGEKPFYYHLGSEHFVFASELRGLLVSGLIPSRVSRAAVVDYLVYESVRSPRTLLEEVLQLPPAHVGWVENGKLTLRSYWRLSPRKGDADVDYGETCRKVRELLERAIDGQRISDVPLGVFLSGGIDSSAITALMAARSEAKLDTLSIAFDDRRFDESPHAQAVATRFGTRHHVIRLKPTVLLDELPAFFASVDAPSGDGLNTYVVAKAARQAGLTVALSGVGGDELFCGYRYFKWYYAYRNHGYLWHMPLGARKLLAPLARTWGPKLEGLMLLEPEDPQGFYELMRSAFPRTEARTLVEASDQYALNGTGSELDGLDRLPVLGQFSALEFANYTRNVLLKDTDNLAMASSLEVRTPFCDHELVEYVLSVPDRFKYPRTPKKLLVDALHGLLPESIVNRPKKGFAFPWAAWMKCELAAFCEASLGSLAQRGLFDASRVRALWQRFRYREGDQAWVRIWLMVSLEQWLKKTGAETS